jgi:2-polyprenyl-3-methyl-5-hydroxy-6-metoxy-1,4-benzoquinol methylase
MTLDQKIHKCRICKKNTSKIFCDLGYSPLANSYPTTLMKKETYYPLKVFFCKNCKLPQLPEHQSAAKIFRNYDYFSSYSKSWIKHSKKYLFEINKLIKLKKNSKICEIASNDGYLLQFFKKKRFKVLGIEPAKNVADVAIKKGICTEKIFFGNITSGKIKKKYGEQDLIIANNVLAHVPDILDFCAGIKNLLSKNGIATFEFPHFLNLIKKFQFDTIYHEHFSYLTVYSIKKLFFKFNLKIFDIKKIETHGGSLRVFVKHKINKKYKITSSLSKFLKLENNSKIFTKKNFSKFNIQIQNIKKNIIDLLLNLKLKKKKSNSLWGSSKR